MVTAFDVMDVNSNPACFDQKKAEAINAEHIRRLDPGGVHPAPGWTFAEHGHDTGLDESDFGDGRRSGQQTRIVVLSDARGAAEVLRRRRRLRDRPEGRVPGNHRRRSGGPLTPRWARLRGGRSGRRRIEAALKGSPDRRSSDSKLRGISARDPGR